MKLSSFLHDLGRPVAYYPNLARVIGGVKETLFLCQMIYWYGKQHNEDGWIYKISEEIKDETGMSYEEQASARKKLIKLGLLKERYDRLRHRMYFFVNYDALDELWSNNVLPLPKPGKPRSGNRESPDRETGKAQIDHYTETTTEITTEITTELSDFSKTDSEEEKDGNGSPNNRRYETEGLSPQAIDDKANDPPPVAVNYKAELQALLGIMGKRFPDDFEAINQWVRGQIIKSISLPSMIAALQKLNKMGFVNSPIKALSSSLMKVSGQDMTVTGINDAIKKNGEEFQEKLKQWTYERNQDGGRNLAKMVMQEIGKKQPANN